MSNATKVENHYGVLGVVLTASSDEIRKAFRDLSLKYHPDRFETKPASERAAAEARFKQINEAYEVLSDPTKREAYDIRMGFKVVVPDAPFDHFVWDNWVNQCITTGHISTLHDFILDSTQPQNLRRHVSIHLFNHYYVSERYDVLYTLAKNPALSFVKKEALVGLVKGYVKQVRRKGVSIPFSDDSSTLSSRWSVIGNPFEQFDHDSIESASRDAVAYLFTTRRSTAAAKMVDYDALHTIAINPAFPESMRILAVVGDESDRSGRFPGLVEVYSASLMVDKLIDLARCKHLDHSSRRTAGVAAVDGMHSYAVSGQEPLYYLNILGAVAYSADSGTVIEEVRSAGVAKAIEVAKILLTKTSATIHIDRIAEIARDSNADEKTRADLTRFIGEASADLQYNRHVRQYFASTAIAIYRTNEDWFSLSDLAKSSSIDVSIRKRAVLVLLDLSRASARPAIREHSLTAAIDCFASLGDTQTLYDVATNPSAKVEISQRAFVALVSLYKDPQNVPLIDELLTNPKFAKFVPEVLDNVLKYYADANYYDGIMVLAIRDYPQEKRTAAAKVYVDGVYRNPRSTSSVLLYYATLDQFTPDSRAYAISRAMDKIDAVVSVASASTDISSDLHVAREIFSTANDDSLKTRSRKQYAKLLQKTTDAALLLGVARDPLFEELDRVDCAKAAIDVLKTSDEGIAVLVEVSKANNLPKAAKNALAAAIPPEFRGEDYYRAVLADSGASAKDKSDALRSLVGIYEKSENTEALVEFATSASWGDNTRKHYAKKAIDIHKKRRNYSALFDLQTNLALLRDSVGVAQDAIIELIRGETNPSTIPPVLYSESISLFTPVVLDRCTAIAADSGFANGARDTATSIAIGIVVKLALPSGRLLEFSKDEGLAPSSINLIADALCKLNPSNLGAVVASSDYPPVLRSKVGMYLVSTLDSSALSPLYGSADTPMDVRVAAGLKIVGSTESFDALSPFAFSPVSQVRGAATSALVRLVDANSLDETQLRAVASDSRFDAALRTGAGNALVTRLSSDPQKTYSVVGDASLPSEVRSAAANFCIGEVISDAKTHSDYDRLLEIAKNPICSLAQRDDAVSAFVEVALLSGSSDRLSAASATLDGAAKTKVDDAVSLLSLKRAGRVDDLVSFAKNTSKDTDLRSFAVGVVCDQYSHCGAVDLLLGISDDRSIPESTGSRIASAITAAQANIDTRLSILVQDDNSDALVSLVTDDRLNVESRSKAASAFLKFASNKGGFRSIVDLARSGALDASLSAQVESALLSSLDKTSENAALASGNIDGLVKLLEISDTPGSVRIEIGRRIVDSLSTRKDRNRLNDLLDQPESKVPESVKSMATKALSNLDVSEVAAKAAPKVNPKDLVAGVVTGVKRKL